MSVLAEIAIDTIRRENAWRRDVRHGSVISMNIGLGIRGDALTDLPLREFAGDADAWQFLAAAQSVAGRTINNARCAFVSKAFRAGADEAALRVIATANRLVVDDCGVPFGHPIKRSERTTAFGVLRATDELRHVRVGNQVWTILVAAGR